MAKAKRRTTKSAVKKTWIPIIAPALFNKQTLGETPVVESSKSIGKTVPVTLSNLTRDMRQQNISVIFEITNLSSNKFFSELIGFEMAAASVKRMVRRGKRKVDYSFEVKTADDYKLRLKVIMITIGLTNLSSLTRLKKACKEEIDKYFAKNSYDRFAAELVGHRVQGTMKKILNKTYPLRLFEVRYMKVLKKPSAEKKKVVKEEAKPEEKPAEVKPAVKEAPKKE
ncbi:MAG: hypothetical protein V3V78_02640 [Candidatus Woesearchaeota archaeon]